MGRKHNLKSAIDALHKKNNQMYTVMRYEYKGGADLIQKLSQQVEVDRRANRNIEVSGDYEISAWTGI